MKMPAHIGVISVYGSQEDARRTEGSWYPDDRNVHDRNVHNIEEQSIATPPEQQIKEKVEPAEVPKQVLLDEDRPDQTVLIGAQLSKDEKN